MLLLMHAYSVARATSSTGDHAVRIIHSFITKVEQADKTTVKTFETMMKANKEFEGRHERLQEVRLQKQDEQLKAQQDVLKRQADIMQLQ